MMFNKVVVRRLLELPKIYSVFQKIIEKNDTRERVFSKYVGDVRGRTILDLGCGTAEVLNYIQGEKLYVGIDDNKKYIDNNKKKFANRTSCKFYCMDLNSYTNKASLKFDIVLMLGVMHHIDDIAVDNAMKNIKSIIKKDGVFVSEDCCYTKGMNPIARALCKLDRGKFVRYADEYIITQKKYWTEVNYDIVTNTLRFLPYCEIFFSNSNPQSKI